MQVIAIDRNCRIFLHKNWKNNVQIHQAVAFQHLRGMILRGAFRNKNRSRIAAAQVTRLHLVRLVGCAGDALTSREG